jgi:putative ABC transport system substrate-binding protein
MMRTATLALCVILSVCSGTLTLAAEAPQPGMVPRIGVLWPISDNPELEAFRQGLRELGYVEGENIVIDYRYARGRDEVLSDLAAELVGLNVDIILTYGVTAAKAARQITKTVPIVNGSMSDPVAAGLAKSLAQPGGNVTGLTSRSPTLSAKRLDLIKELIPALSRIAILSTPAPTAQLGLRETEVAARSLGLSLFVQQVQGPSDFESAFSAIAKAPAEASIKSSRARSRAAYPSKDQQNSSSSST